MKTRYRVDRGRRTVQSPKPKVQSRNASCVLRVALRGRTRDKMANGVGARQFTWPGPSNARISRISQVKIRKADIRKVWLTRSRSISPRGPLASPRSLSPLPKRLKSIVTITTRNVRFRREFDMGQEFTAHQIQNPNEIRGNHGVHKICSEILYLWRGGRSSSAGGFRRRQGYGGRDGGQVGRFSSAK